jgi:hypothetical protein
VSDTTVEYFVGLESAVWDALVRGDAAADRAQLSEDFLGVYPTGFADRTAHADQLEDGPTVFTYEIMSPVIRTFAVEHVLLSYEARFQRRATGRAERMYVSSLWSRRDNEWVNVFSQDTPAAG